MRALHPLAAALATLTLSAAPSVAADTATGGAPLAAPVIEAPETVVYVFPTSPQSFVPYAPLPSFLFMPGAPVPEIATQVVYTMAMPAPVVAAVPAVIPADLDCSQIAGVVLAPAPDPYNLDRDGDGIGCEPEDR